MAHKPLNLNSFESFTFPDDTEDPRTVWHLGPIDAQLMASLDDELMLFQNDKEGRVDQRNPTSEKWMKVAINTRYVEIVRFGLKGWENFITDEEKQVPFLTQEYAVNRVGLRTGVKDELLRTIRLSDIVALAQRILELNRLSGADAKN